MDNPELTQAINRAFGEVNIYEISKLYSLACVHCGRRFTSSLGDGQYHCKPCNRKFYFADWYKKVINGPRAV